MDFRTYQDRAHRTAITTDVEIFSLGLVGEAGGIASAIKKYKRDQSLQHVARREIREELGDALWYIAEIAKYYGINLDEVASENLRKTEYLFVGKNDDFDLGFPPEQQLPKELAICFDDRGKRLSIQIDGVQIGDELTDNAHEEDGYRFHDVFHLAYMTFLGWSPVIRDLLGRKRRKDPQIDEVEDGARARALEEAISIMIFSQTEPRAAESSLFSEPAQIPFWILETIKKMTSNLEVRARSVNDWRNAVAQGYTAFDQLRQKHGGVIECDRIRKVLRVV